MGIKDDNFYTTDTKERDWCLKPEQIGGGGGGGSTDGHTVCYVLDKKIAKSGDDLIGLLASAGQPSSMRASNQQPTELYRLLQNKSGDQVEFL